MNDELNVEELFLENDKNLVTIPEKAKMLFHQQIKNWKLAGSGYKSLSKVKIKKFEFDGFSIEAHFNPGRIISSSAKVDDQSIKERECFLCINNLPQNQKAVKLFDNYILLLNPFPIFDEHFTIPSTKHIPQAIEHEFGNMLKLNELLGANYSIFYNGPKCGASAPDHMHFQAGNFGFMKIDYEYVNILNNYGKIISNIGDLLIAGVNDGLRKFILLQSTDEEQLKRLFAKIYNLLKSSLSDEEPMMNIITNYNNGWRVMIFPRKLHRPSYFFMEGNNKILISPAAVDLGGVLIFPREEDFEKINKELIVDIFKQVTINDEEFEKYTNQIV